MPAVAVCGCGPYSNRIHHHNPMQAGETLSPHSQWRATSADVTNAAGAVDGDLDTVAVSGSGSRGHAITIDLGRPCLFNMVNVDHGTSDGGQCGRVALQTSIDGRNYTLRKTVPGMRRITNICIIRPTLARYIRIEIAERGSGPWRIAEVYVR